MSLTDLQDMKPKMNHLQSLRKVDIEDIRENIHNIFAQRDIEELKENIKKDGLLKPLEVYQDGDQYILIGGHRRYNALLELYMEDAVEPEINCIVYPKPNSENDEMLQIITSNAQRNMSKDEMVEVTKILLKVLENEPDRKPYLMDRRTWIGGYLGVCGKTAQEYINIANGKETKKKAKVIDHTFDYAEELLRNKFRTKAKISKNKLTLSFRGNDTVRGIFSHCLHCCPGNSALIQHRGIPSHNHGYVVSGLLCAACLQAAAHLHAFCIQSPGSQHETAQEPLCQQKCGPGPGRPQKFRRVNDCPWNTPPYHTHGGGKDGPCPGLPFPSRSLCPSSEPLFHPGNHGSHKAHRMGKPQRIPYDPVNHTSRQQGRTVKFP